MKSAGIEGGYKCRNQLKRCCLVVVGNVFRTINKTKKKNVDNNIVENNLLKYSCKVLVYFNNNLKHEYLFFTGPDNGCLVRDKSEETVSPVSGRFHVTLLLNIGALTSSAGLGLPRTLRTT